MNFQNILCLRLLKLKMIGYIDRVRCKIIELALVGYEYTSAYSPLRAFLCVKSLCFCISMVKLERDIFGCAGLLCTCRPTLFSFATLTWS